MGHPALSNIWSIICSVIHITITHLRIVLHYARIGEGYIWFTHVELFVEHHTELADLLYVTALPRVQSEALSPYWSVSFRQSDDVPGRQELSGLVPYGHVDAGGLVCYFERPHLPVFFGDRRQADVQDYEHDIEILQARLQVLYENVFGGVHPVEAHITGGRCLEGGFFRRDARPL